MIQMGRTLAGSSEAIGQSRNRILRCVTLKTGEITEITQ